MGFKFEELKVWQKSISLSNEIAVLVKAFPKDEIYVLTSQIKRAADSISLNIAEGSTGQSNAEFNKFLGYALRSAIEVVGCLHLAKGRDLITDQQFNSFYELLTEIVKMIQAFRNKLGNE